MTDALPIKNNGRWRVRIGLGATIIGFIIFLVGAEPGLFALDRSAVVGFVQISTFLVGLGLICLGGYIALAALWNGGPKSIISDIGLRLVGTGYVISVACGMADVFGFGSHRFPNVPIFGHWQMTGVVIGEAVIAIGLLMFIPYQKPQSRSEE